MKALEALSGNCAGDFNTPGTRSLQHGDQLIVAEHILAIEQRGGPPIASRLDIIRPVIEEKHLVMLDLDLVALLDTSDDPREHLILWPPANLRICEVFGQPESRQDLHRRLVVITAVYGDIDLLLPEKIKEVMNSRLELDPEPLVCLQPIRRGEVKRRLDQRTESLGNRPESLVEVENKQLVVHLSSDRR